MVINFKKYIKEQLCVCVCVHLNITKIAITKTRIDSEKSSKSKCGCQLFVLSQGKIFLKWMLIRLLFIVFSKGLESSLKPIKAKLIFT